MFRRIHEVVEQIQSEIQQLLSEEIETLNRAIETQIVVGADERKKKRCRLKKYHQKIAEDFIPCKEKHTTYQATSNGRNSFSKTDVERIFMANNLRKYPKQRA
ncbi:hypothetical protein [Facklamia sp. P12950]|uniref:hypothetical protein n=1 Tax=Facklamia sp. P12950 TaxID=3421951 RepID=UPI003D16380C